MKTHLKRIAVAGALSGTLFVGGCGSPDSTSPANQSVPTSEPTPTVAAGNEVNIDTGGSISEVKIELKDGRAVSCLVLRNYGVGEVDLECFEPAKQ